ncbi:RICIN domain-containing protein [Pedobacter nototheniae]|uniref:EndoS/ChiA family endoglycosidase n=1 Tax=Pedobacter nototheniae TaxID=2488994 RepID=UPI00292F1781|nr:RICIN domain-containing protein [Pedobacter nototheniae]
MKRVYNNIRRILLMSLICMAFAACKKNDAEPRPALKLAASSSANTASLATSPSDLIAYKKSPHEISAGFYRVAGPCYPTLLDGSNFSLVPDSLDILILFCFSPSSPIIASVPGWINTLHAKGTKVIMTGNLDLIPGAGHNTAGYQATAKSIMDNLVNKYNLDGYDIDVEDNPTGQTLTDLVGVYTALSAYLGPKSGTGKLLTFDTNQPGSNNMFQQVYTMIDYVWMQRYGANVGVVQATWDTYKAYIPSTKWVPAFSFFEGTGGFVWNDVHYPVNGTGTAFDYANWEPSGGGKKGGVASYAIDRDAPLTSSSDGTLYIPNYIVTNKLIKIMNPAASGGIVSGATYQIVTAVNNTSVLDIFGGGSANGTIVELWTKNTPVSANQKFVITSVAGGRYKLQPANAPGKVMTVRGAGTADGTQVDIYTDSGASNQQWAIVDVGGGNYTITPANAPTKPLDLNGYQTANGSKIDIWTNGGGNNQKWKFVKQ